MGKKKDLLTDAFTAIRMGIDYEVLSVEYADAHWKWDGKIVTPKMIDETVTRLVSVVIDEKLESVSSGGITVLKTKGYLAILFLSKEDDSVIAGEFHTELSRIDAVSEYFEYIYNKQSKKKGS